MDDVVSKELCDERFSRLQDDLAEIKAAVKCLPGLVQRVENHDKMHERDSTKLLALAAMSIAFLAVLVPVIVAIVKG